MVNISSLAKTFKSNITLIAYVFAHCCAIIVVNVLIVKNTPKFKDELSMNFVLFSYYGIFLVVLVGTLGLFVYIARFLKMSMDIKNLAFTCGISSLITFVLFCYIFIRHSDDLGGESVTDKKNEDDSGADMAINYIKAFNIFLNIGRLSLVIHLMIEKLPMIQNK